MRRQRLTTMIAIVAVLGIAAGAAEAKTFSLHIGLSRGHSIARPFGSGGCTGTIVRRPLFVRPPSRGFVIRSPLRSRIMSIRPHHHSVVVRKPCVSSVVVAPRPTYVVTPPRVTVQPTTITVWIRNSNGSQSPVELSRSGPGYVGPRGEYYPSMPNNEQLRMVYGF